MRVGILSTHVSPSHTRLRCLSQCLALGTEWEMQPIAGCQEEGDDAAVHSEGSWAMCCQKADVDRQCLRAIQLNGKWPPNNSIKRQRQWSGHPPELATALSKVTLAAFLWIFWERRGTKNMSWLNLALIHIA